ncbi:ABC transporter permease [Pseudonocardia halophobica]|uniref:ABC transporter permease n=1 Tax=Pseudonocardia halophobica TaxID=29401 RepID=UPI003D8EEAA5
MSDGVLVGPTLTPPAAAPTRAVPRRGRVLRRLLRQPVATGALVFLLLVVLVAVLAPWIAPYDPDQQDLIGRLAPPSGAHWLGQDDFGRDELSRLMFGARISLLASLQAVGIGVLVGVTGGLLAGFVGGRLDGLLGRLVDILMAVPGLLFAITVVAVLGPGLTTAMLAVGLLLAPPLFRVSRATTRAVREETYIEASRALGYSTRRTVFHHVLPNMVAPVLVQITILLGLAITIEASLSFLGLGVQPPTATWGSMLSDANAYMAQAPHLIYVPGAMIAATVLAFSLLGDGLARALGTSRFAVTEKS